MPIKVSEACDLIQRYYFSNLPYYDPYMDPDLSFKEAMLILFYQRKKKEGVEFADFRNYDIDQDGWYRFIAHFTQPMIYGGDWSNVLRDRSQNIIDYYIDNETGLPHFRIADLLEPYMKEESERGDDFSDLEVRRKRANKERQHKSRLIKKAQKLLETGKLVREEKLIKANETSLLWESHFIEEKEKELRKAFASSPEGDLPLDVSATYELLQKAYRFRPTEYIYKMDIYLTYQEFVLIENVKDARNRGLGSICIASFKPFLRQWKETEAFEYNDVIANRPWNEILVDKSDVILEGWYGTFWGRPYDWFAPDVDSLPEDIRRWKRELLNIDDRRIRIESRDEVLEYIKENKLNER